MVMLIGRTHAISVIVGVVGAEQTRRTPHRSNAKALSIAGAQERLARNAARHPARYVPLL